MRRQVNIAIRALALTALAASAGCELFQRQPAPNDGRNMMMIADSVPLAATETQPQTADAMPVPVEPSPFERANPDKPHAMLSDILKPTSRTDSVAPRALPREPVP